MERRALIQFNAVGVGSMTTASTAMMSNAMMATVSKTVPAAVPANSTAPAEAAAPGVAAPIKPGPTPGAVVPAIVSSAIDELRLLNIRGSSALHGVIHEHRIGVSNRKNERERRCCGGIDRSH
jgi:hypothetical protein